MKSLETKFRKDVNVLSYATMDINWVRRKYISRIKYLIQTEKNLAGGVKPVVFGVQMKRKLHVKSIVRFWDLKLASPVCY